MNIKESILLTVEDLVGSFMYYDRKEDEELGRGEIEAAIKNKDITVDDIVDQFRSSLLQGLK